MQDVGMMEGHDIIIGRLLIFLVESLDEMYIFRDRRNNDHVRSGKIFFVEPFAEELRIKLQRLYNQAFRQGVWLYEIVGLVPILNDTVVFIHLLQCAHSQVQYLYAMIKSVLDLDRFAAIFRDIQQHKIIFLQVISEEEERMERLGQDVYIFHVEEVPIDGIDDIHRLFMEIYNI